MLGSPCSPCCGGCDKCSPLASPSGGIASLQSVEITLDSSDYFRSELWEYSLQFGLTTVEQSLRDAIRAKYATFGITPGYKFSTAVYFPGSSIAGTYSLSSVQHNAVYSSYRYTFPAFGAICSGSYIECIIYQAGYSDAADKASLGYKIDVTFELNVPMFRWCIARNSLLATTDSWCQQSTDSFSSFGDHIAFSQTMADPNGSGKVIYGCDTCLGFYGSGTRTINTQTTGLNLFPLYPQIFGWYANDAELRDQIQTGSFSTTLSNITLVP